TFNESLHDRPRRDLDDQKVRQSQAFSHSLGRKQPVATERNRPNAASQCLQNQVRFRKRSECL
ncbi:hypothetical protein, partial [Pseudomonas monteilii]